MNGLKSSGLECSKWNIRLIDPVSEKVQFMEQVKSMAVIITT